MTVWCMNTRNLFRTSEFFLQFRVHCIKCRSNSHHSGKISINKCIWQIPRFVNETPNRCSFVLSLNSNFIKIMAVVAVEFIQFFLHQFILLSIQQKNIYYSVKLTSNTDLLVTNEKIMIKEQNEWKNVRKFMLVRNETGIKWWKRKITVELIK